MTTRRYAPRLSALRASMIGALRLNNVRGFSIVNHNCRIFIPFSFIAGKVMGGKGVVGGDRKNGEVKEEGKDWRGEVSRGRLKNDDYLALRASLIGTTCLDDRRFAPQ